MTTKDNELSATMKFRKITAEEQQQEFCSYLGYQSEIIWEEYDLDINSDAKRLLLRKINLIFGDEIDETTGSDESMENSNGEKLRKLKESLVDATIAQSSKKETFRKMKENLVETIWKQRKYNKNILLMSPIFVALVTDYEQYADDITRCKGSVNYSLHPVFRIIKCRRNGKSHKCCMIFVDENARVYQNWAEFKANNEYSPGYLVAPALGVYNTVDIIDSNNLNRVLLDIFPSISSKSSSKLAAKADKISTVAVGGLAAAGVTAATIVSIPMLPVIAAGAIVTGISCAAYSAGRSAFKLMDRSKHEQTINVKDTKARSHWFGLASGAFGFGAGAAVGGAAVSKVGQVVAGSASILNGSGLLMNGIGTLNGIYALFLAKYDFENISLLKMRQLSSSLFIFTHSVYNSQTADIIARSCSRTTMGEYRRALSRGQQNAFDNLVKQTIRENGVHADVIRPLRTIKDTKDIFHDACEVDDGLDHNISRMSLDPDIEYLYEEEQQPTDPTEIQSAGETMNINENSLSHDRVVVAVKKLIELGIFVENKEDLESLMIEFANQVNIYVFDIFIDFMQSYFNENSRCISEILKENVSFDCFFENTMDIIRNSAKSDGMDIGEYIENIDSNHIRLQINEFYNQQRIRREVRGRRTEHCKICFGTYYVVAKKESD